MTQDEPLRGVCLACLRPRDDLDAAWLAAATDRGSRTSYACADDFAFSSHRSVQVEASCPACGNSSIVIPVSQRTAATIASYIAGR